MTSNFVKEASNLMGEILKDNENDSVEFRQAKAQLRALQSRNSNDVNPPQEVDPSRKILCSSEDMKRWNTMLNKKNAKNVIITIEEGKRKLFRDKESHELFVLVNDEKVFVEEKSSSNN